MLEIQKYLLADPENINKLGEIGINAIFHPTKPLVLLNYNQIEVSKTNTLSWDCRGTVLELGSFKLIARGFPRFFNLGEMLDLHKNFNWDSFSCASKEDGSFINYFQYEGEVYITTRGSWCEGFVNGSGLTWKELFKKAVPDPLFDTALDDHNYIFELCSIFNRVVKSYPKTTAYLLSTFTGEVEWTVKSTDYLTNLYGLNRPEHYQFKSQEEILGFLEYKAETDKTYEGVVLRDSNNMRIKCKSKSYIALHHLRDNDNIFLPKYLVPLCLSGEIDEALCYWDDLIEPAREMKTRLDLEFAKMMELWADVRNIQDQKKFALSIIDKSPFIAILFKARKLGVCPSKIWRESPELIVKVLFQ